MEVGRCDADDLRMYMRMHMQACTCMERGLEVLEDAMPMTSPEPLRHGPPDEAACTCHAAPSASSARRSASARAVHAATASSSEAAALGEEAAELREEAEALRAAFAAAATARTGATEAAEVAEAEVARLRVELDEARQRSRAASEAAAQGVSEVGMLTRQLEQRAALLAEREERMADAEARLHDRAHRRDERVRTAAVQMLARRADALQRSRLLSRCWQGLVRNTCASVLRADRRRFRAMMQAPGSRVDECAFDRVDVILLSKMSWASSGSCPGIASSARENSARGI